MEYKELKVLVRNRSDILIFKPSGVVSDATVPMDSLREKTIQMFSGWLSDGKITKREELEILGTHLYEGLFDTETKNAFEKEWENVQKQSKGLRLVLEFGLEAREIAEMPWEYIYYPAKKYEQGFFLAAVSRLILARQVPPSSDLVKQLKPEQRPLRILIVVSKPNEEQGEEPLGTVNGDFIIETVEILKRKWPNEIETDTLFQPTRHSLANEVDHFSPHVLHFIGHGRYTDAGGGALAFVSENNEKTASWINDQTFADCFMNHKPRLIFLHACKGAYSKSYRAFRGIALQLVYSQIPAVVAMQYEVENIVANLFAKIFYQSLGKGKRIDEAVQDGRMELGMFLDEGQSFSSRAFGSPVVYLQSAEGIIIAEAQQAGLDMSQASSITPSTFRCPNCSKPVTANQNFCRKCGKALMPCPNPNCRQMMLKDDDYCGSCGYPGTNSISASARVDAGPPCLTCWRAGSL